MSPLTNVSTMTIEAMGIGSNGGLSYTCCTGCLPIWARCWYWCLFSCARLFSLIGVLDAWLGKPRFLVGWGQEPSTGQHALGSHSFLGSEHILSNHALPDLTSTLCCATTYKHCLTTSLYLMVEHLRVHHTHTLPSSHHPPWHGRCKCQQHTQLAYMHATLQVEEVVQDMLANGFPSMYESFLSVHAPPPPPRLK